MTVLVLASSKGGGGKSTLTMGIAGVLARQGADVVLVDADPTNASGRWATSIYEGTPFPSHSETNEDRLAMLIADLRERHRVVLVDTPGFGNLASNIAIASADFVLIPCKVSEADLHETRTTASKVAALSATTRRKIPARVVLNSLRTTSVAAHTRTMIAEAGLETLSATLGLRADYEAMTYSGAVPKTGAAMREIEALVDELRALDWLPTVKAGKKVAA